MRQTQNRILNERVILMMNNALAMENAAVERLQNRVTEVNLQDVKEHLEHHLDETREQQKRLKDLIGSTGGSPTEELIGLPLPSYPQSLRREMENSLTPYEWELKKVEEDMIVENAEIVCYNNLIQKLQIMNKSDLVMTLRQNLHEEEEMMKWFNTNGPSTLNQLWPKIESSIKAR